MNMQLKIAFVFLVLVISLTYAESSENDLDGVYIAELISDAEIEVYTKNKSLSTEGKRVKLYRATIRAGLPAGQFQIKQRSDKFVFGKDKSIRYIDNVIDFGGKYEIEGNEIKLTIYGYNKPPGENDNIKMLTLESDGTIKSSEEYLDWLVFRKWSPKLDYSKATVAGQREVGPMNALKIEEHFKFIKRAIKNKSVEGKPISSSKISHVQYQFETEYFGNQ